MTSAAESMELQGKLLVAMPGMGDPRFDQSVVFVCTHSADGAMGLIVNKPTDDLKLSDLLAQLKIENPAHAKPVPVHMGGPVEHGRGFVLHSGDYGSNEATMVVGTDYGMTATLDILEDISNGEGPKNCILAMGYSGWGPGQLEAEIGHNGWLICDPTTQIVFDTKDGLKWQAALKSMGIDPLLLSAEAGHA